MEPQPTSSATVKSPQLTLLLSGGGFRAALFHLGVIRYLHTAGLLPRVTRIFSISGGSVLGAHLVLNWERYVSRESFEEVARAMEEFATSDVRGKIVRRRVCFALGFPVVLILVLAWLGSPLFVCNALQGVEHWHGWLLGILITILWICLTILVAYLGNFLQLKWRDPTAMLVDYLNTFYQVPSRELPQGNDSSSKLPLPDAATSTGPTVRPATLRDLESDPAKENNRPELNVLATVFSAGTSCAFGGFGIRLLGLDKKNVTIPTAELEVGRAVAASAAFPALFPPVTIPASTVGKEFFEGLNVKSLVLTDGGVFDNLGIGQLKLSSNSDESDIIVVSDAQAAFRPDLDTPYSGFLERQVRVLDVLMNRITLLSEQLLDAQPIKLRIGRIVTKGPVRSEHLIPPEDQERLARTRTDFDDFSHEAVLLQYHGFCVAREVFHDPQSIKALGGNQREAPQHPQVFEERRLRGVSVRGQYDPARRRWSLFSRKDRVSYAIAAFGVCWIVAALAFWPHEWLALPIMVAALIGWLLLQRHRAFDIEV
jgi:predicted acylesterase/phospholipase RssA